MNIPVSRAPTKQSRHVAIKGTSTDCALLTIYEILDLRPTMLPPGIT
jgi:broad specificity polyphosphatase/5'/3'-nucleotidase SurE